MLLSLFHSSAFSLSHDTANQWLVAQWHGAQDYLDSLAVCAIILQHARELALPKLLCDSSQALDGWDGIGQWVSTNYLPQLADTGVCLIAWINAQDWHTSHTITNFIQHSEKPFVATFQEGATAYEWLRNTHFICP